MEWTLETVFLVCAVVGGAILLLQLLLLLLGGDADGGDFDLDADADVDAGVDHDGHADALGWLSIRTVAAFFTFFGLVGFLGVRSGWPTLTTITAALGAGGAMMGLVAWLFASLHKLQSSGNLDPKLAVGATGQVYLKIPGNQSGKGKVTVSVEGRARQFEAVTSGPELPTGSEVRVVRMTTPSTFEVAALD